MLRFLKESFAQLNTSLMQAEEKRILFIIFLFTVLNAVKLASFNVILLGDMGRTLDFLFKIVLCMAIAAVYTFFFLKLNNKWFFLVSYILQFLYLFINLSYYLYFRSYLHIVQWVTLLAEGFTIAKNLVIPVGFEMVVLLLDLPFFILIFARFNKSASTKKAFAFPALILVVLSVLAFIAAEVFYDSNRTIAEKIEPAAINTETVSVKRYGTVINEVINIFSNSSDEERVEKIKFGKEVSAEKTKENSPNIVYIQVESLDANIVSKKQGGDYVMPFLAGLRGNSIYYPYTLSYHMGGGTSDCEFSAINSVEAIPGFPALKLQGFDFSNSFVKRLKTGGYSTLAFHGNKAKFFTRDEAYPQMGYDRFYDIEALNLEESGWGASDKDLFDSTLKVLKTQKEPYFAHVITMTSHEPYNNIEKCGDFHEFDEVENSKVRNYMSSMRYVDEQLEAFITGLQKSNKNTYFVIFGDHMSNVESDEYSMCGYVYENKLFEFVPFFIITPENEKYEEKNTVASFKDFALTVLDISGVEYKIRSDGKSLLEFGKLPETVTLRESDYNRSEIFEKAKEKQESDAQKAKD